jgi:NAD(P)-dependent dehydrogenase (short-subunit alcohol dehydrogenase family)
MSTATPPLVLANEAAAPLALAKAIDGDLEALPAVGETDRFEAWRAEAVGGPLREQVVVCVWPDPIANAPLLEVDADAWRQRFEAPYLLWNFALGAASRRCADGGAHVARVQAPAALDAPGRTPELAIADGVLSLVRSVAAAEGARGVRANLVTTPIGLVEGEIVAPAPPLPGFPGTLETHVAGAVRALLSNDSVGLTGRVLPADGGRSL